MAEEQQEVVPEKVDAAVVFDAPTKNLLKSAEGALTYANSFVIESHADLEDAVAERNANIEGILVLETKLKRVITPFKEGLKRLEELFKPGIQRREAAKNVLNTMIVAWEVKQQQIADDARRRKEAEARQIREDADRRAAAARAQADEQARQAAAASQAQQEALQRAQEEGNAAAAEEAAQASARLQEESRQATERANRQAEQIVLEAAAATATRTSVVQRTIGNTMRDKWEATLIADTTEEQAKLKIVQAIVNDKRLDLLGVLELDTSALRRLAGSLKVNMNVPGYKAVNNPIAAKSKN